MLSLRLLLSTSATNQADHTPATTQVAHTPATTQVAHTPATTQVAHTITPATTDHTTIPATTQVARTTMTPATTQVARTILSIAMVTILFPIPPHLITATITTMLTTHTQAPIGSPHHHIIHTMAHMEDHPTHGHHTQPHCHMQRKTTKSAPSILLSALLRVE